MDPGPTKKFLGPGPDPRKIKNYSGPGLGMPAAPYRTGYKNVV